MSELTFEQMLDESFKTIHNGEVVDGTVIDVKPDEIILNIGYKADGIITRSEYTNDNSVDLTTVVSVGDPMTVKVLKVNDGEGQIPIPCVQCFTACSIVSHWQLGCLDATIALT